LAPEQVRVLTVSQKSEEYGRTVEARLRKAGLRVSGDFRPEKLNAKVREAQLKLIPYMLVVGERDAAAGSVAVRDRIDGDLGTMQLEAAIEKLLAEVTARTVRQKPKLPGAALSEGSGENEY
jgi:threonyl-tRNA synthetase